MTNKPLTGAEAENIAKMYAGGASERAIARAISRSRTAVSNELRRQGLKGDAAGPRTADRPVTEPDTTPEEGRSEVRDFTAEEIGRIASLDDLLSFFKVDRDAWEVRDYRVNKWEQASGNKATGITITPMYQVRANLIPRIERRIEVVKQICADLIADANEHAAPTYAPIVREAPARPERTCGDCGAVTTTPTLTHCWICGDKLPPFAGHPDPVLLEIAIFDTHLGMLAWADEVGGQSYDSSIAVRDYAKTTEQLLANAAMYPVERILFIVGNDFLHVDTAGLGMKGGTTAAGTPQDIDTRHAKMFTTGRRALVAAIDKARLIAPVDVLVVPGNHDAQSMYRMGETLFAWYRNDPEVQVTYGPNKRKFYGYGKNALMFTHGEEYRRQRDSLPLIFATECPAELWVSSEHREIHTGHNHAAMAGRYTPESDLTESRGIRTRSLPGLTATDAWHHESGYKHRRAATALAFRKSGGLAGFHEFTL